ncbi:hypothetical protein AVEN_139059-1 [Araneus ventricosus]|uniref:Uncharacterized protein n=1 Tax=Araneus ventricosus TaxID=182803 RepID=A0A4Y2T638_ARAVE|nr:hypothetical protein AVEN_139059-1 [Araneus ventricosus]
MEKYLGKEFKEMRTDYNASIAHCYVSLLPSQGQANVVRSFREHRRLFCTHARGGNGLVSIVNYTDRQTVNPLTDSKSKKLRIQMRPRWPSGKVFGLGAGGPQVRNRIPLKIRYVCGTVAR